MTLIENIQQHSGIMLTEDEKAFKALNEDFELLGFKEAKKLYETLFFVKFGEDLNEGKVEDLAANQPPRGGNRGDPNKSTFGGTGLKDNLEDIKSVGPVKTMADRLKNASGMPAKSIAVEATERSFSRKALEDAAAKMTAPKVNLTEFGKEAKDSFIANVNSGNLEAASKAIPPEVIKDVYATGASRTLAKGATAVAAPTSMLGKIWQGIKGFFTGGWKGITAAFKSGNYASLLQIPLVQVGLAVGGTALAFKILKGIKNKLSGNGNKK